MSKTEEVEVEEYEDEEEDEEDGGERARKRKEKKEAAQEAERQRTAWNVCEELFSSQRANNGGFEVNRLLFVAGFTSFLQNKKDLNKYYETLFAKQNSEIVGEITGLCLVLPQSTVHIIEASPKVISDLLLELSKPQDSSQQSAENQLLKDVKVIAVAEDITERLFPAWEFRILSYDRALELAPEESSTESPQSLSITLHTNMLKLGESLSNMNDSDKALYSATLENLRASQVRDLLPTAEEIAGIIDSNQIFPLSDFVATYFDPINFDLDPDQIC